MSLTPSGFGVELHGIDLREIEEREQALLVEAFHDSGGLVLVRGQAGIGPGAFLEFARVFGDLENNEKYDPELLLPGFPEILRIGNLKENGRYRSLFVEADPPPLLWHTDDSFRHPQPLGSCLLCIETPPGGGETGYAGMAQAYDALSPELRARIEGRTAVHSYHYLNEYLRQRNPHRPPLSPELRAKHPPVRRPLVAVHPVTRRKSLYIPRCHIESIEGLSGEESDALLAELLAHATGPSFAFLHRWAPGDVVVWDNRSVLHAPTPFASERHSRLLYRITMAGAQIAGF